MNMKNFFIIVILVILCHSCNLFLGYQPKWFEHTQLFSKDYRPEYKGKLNIDGYWYTDVCEGLPCQKNLYTYKFALHADGSVMFVWFPEKYWDRIGKPINFDDFGENYEYLSLDSGIYQIDGDTLCIDRFIDHGLISGYTTIKYKYLIDDENTLRLLESKEIGIDYTRVYKMDEIYHFVKAQGLKSPHLSKLKREKWMWENENDRKEFLREAKAYQHEARHRNDSNK